MKIRKLVILGSLSALLLTMAVPGASAQQAKEPNYQMNLEATYNAVKEHDQVEALPPDKKLGLWEAFMQKFPTDNKHAEEAKERIAYWKSKVGGAAPATVPTATRVPATSTPVPATSTPVPATPTPKPAAPAATSGAAE